MSKTIAIIPARIASSRFPRKVLADIAGKSLLRRTYEQVCQCTSLDEVLIAADDESVAEHAKDFGAKVVMTFPSLPSGTHRIAAAYQLTDSKADIILNVQADEPCFDPEIGERLIEEMQQRQEIELITPISLITNPEDIFNPSVVKCVADSKGRALYFSRAPIPYPQKPKLVRGYYRHLGVYCFRRPCLLTYVQLPTTPLQQAEDLEQLKLLENGHAIHVCVVTSQAIAVDTPDDLKKVEALLCQTQESISL